LLEIGFAFMEAALGNFMGWGLTKLLRLMANG
jgi:hypothetical protein